MNILCFQEVTALLRKQKKSSHCVKEAPSSKGWITLKIMADEFETTVNPIVHFGHKHHTTCKQNNKKATTNLNSYNKISIGTPIFELIPFCVWCFIDRCYSIIWRYRRNNINDWNKNEKYYVCNAAEDCGQSSRTDSSATMGSISNFPSNCTDYTWNTDSGICLRSTMHSEATR